MKRYRIINYDFDTRVKIFTMAIKPDANKQIKELHIDNTTKIYTHFLSQYGLMDSVNNVRNFIEINSKPFSIIAFHNKFQDQIRNSYIIGSFYPSLVAACALGERILNHLILKLRDNFRNTQEYRKVYRRNSFDNWDLAIATLESWRVLLPDTIKYFKKLKKLRNRSIHFNPITDTNDKELALEAIKILTDIIKTQFPVMGTQPWFIPNMKGESYIKKEYEDYPFIKNIYLPNAIYVGPYHKIEQKDNRSVVVDNFNYDEKGISDDEYRKFRYGPR
jgi:hypothetical protein